MQDTGFVIGFFIVLIFLAILSASGVTLLGDVATSTPSTRSTPSGGTTISQGGHGGGRTEPRLSNEEVERRVARIFDELDKLSEEIRQHRLREPASPYVGMVELGRGNARSTDPDREYLILTADNGNESGINISDWYLESYVTENRTAIPDGARILERFRSQKASAIFLEPGQKAYLSTNEPPFNISFHENICTGYLRYQEDFYPSLSRSCPDPEKEMLRFANIALDNDACYDFVERIGRCELVDENDARDADISKACEKFVIDNLDYDSCVDNHRYDPFFDNVGHWRIYLDRDEEQWRKEREIIRLLDGNDRVIDVIEY